MVLDLATGNAVGLHYAGIYEEDNFAVRASVLTDYIRRKRWNSPPMIETRASRAVAASSVPVSPVPVAPTVRRRQRPPWPRQPGASVSVTIPVTVTVSIGTPLTNVAPRRPRDDNCSDLQPRGATTTGTSADPTGTVATPAYRPPAVDCRSRRRSAAGLLGPAAEGVLAARVGYFDKDDAIGDVPCIAVSVKPSNAFDVRARRDRRCTRACPFATCRPTSTSKCRRCRWSKSVDSISYDDDARTGDRFSFAQVNEPMEVTLHVGPEYSWEVLEKFINDSRRPARVGDVRVPCAAHQGRASRRGSKPAARSSWCSTTRRSRKFGTGGSFDRVEVFEDWADRFAFHAHRRAGRH